MLVIINYGMGNLWSIQSALNYLGVDSTINSDPGVISRADRLILPGVGSFSKAMTNLKAGKLETAIKDAVSINKIPLMGICLGMQLLGLSSTEDGSSGGLGFVSAPVERFDEKACSGLKIPHVGFDTVLVEKGSKLFKDLDQRIDFYFTHSYSMPYADQPYAQGTCVYGEKFIAAFEEGRVCGTQFHPEKSQTNGLRVLKNFIENF